jgi:adenine/guanine phosphoribosyltransferase-like PRPP-binding protein
MVVQKQLAAPKKVVLVDDVVTRGHTFIAGASLIHDTYPNCEIKAFAAMRTMSYESIFVKEYEPVIGDITYRPVLDDCIRRP